MPRVHGGASSDQRCSLIPEDYGLSAIIRVDTPGIHLALFAPAPLSRVSRLAQPPRGVLDKRPQTVYLLAHLYYLRPTILNDDDRPRSDTGLQPRTNQLMILMDHYPMRSSLTTCFSESGARTLL